MAEEQFFGSECALFNDSGYLQRTKRFQWAHPLTSLTGSVGTVIAVAPRVTDGSVSVFTYGTGFVTDRGSDGVHACTIATASHLFRANFQQELGPATEAYFCPRILAKVPYQRWTTMESKDRFLQQHAAGQCRLFRISLPSPPLFCGNYFTPTSNGFPPLVHADAALHRVSFEFVDAGGPGLLPLDEAARVFRPIPPSPVEAFVGYAEVIGKPSRDFTLLHLELVRPDEFAERQKEFGTSTPTVDDVSARIDRVFCNWDHVVSAPVSALSVRSDPGRSAYTVVEHNASTTTAMSGAPLVCWHEGRMHWLAVHTGTAPLRPKGAVCQALFECYCLDRGSLPAVLAELRSCGMPVSEFEPVLPQLLSAPTLLAALCVLQSVKLEYVFMGWDAVNFAVSGVPIAL